MAFKLDSIVPWGRNMSEYRMMFQLNDEDMSKKIAGFGDGPASFNYEANQEGHCVTSFDPIYQFTRNDLQRRIEEVRITVMQQLSENTENYVWTHIKSLKDLENVRMSAMRVFLADYERGKSEKRYVYHELPNKLVFDDNTFDIGLSSHFLLMYTALGYDFHIQSISEMLRVCKEVRIFPIVDLDANDSNLTNDIIAYFQKLYHVEIRGTDYEFQKSANRLLVIKK